MVTHWIMINIFGVIAFTKSDSCILSKILESTTNSNSISGGTSCSPSFFCLAWRFACCHDYCEFISLSAVFYPENNFLFKSFSASGCYSISTTFLTMIAGSWEEGYDIRPRLRRSTLTLILHIMSSYRCLC